MQNEAMRLRNRDFKSAKCEVIWDRSWMEAIFIPNLRKGFFDPGVLQKSGTFWGRGSLLTEASEEAGVHDDCGGWGLSLTRAISPSISGFQFLSAVRHLMNKSLEK